MLHEDNAHEANRCVRNATREREGDDWTTENDENHVHFLNTMPLECVFSSREFDALA